MAVELQPHALDWSELVGGLSWGLGGEAAVGVTVLDNPCQCLDCTHKTTVRMAEHTWKRRERRYVPGWLNDKRTLVVRLVAAGLRDSAQKGKVNTKG